MQVNSQRKATQIIGQRKAFYMQRIHEYSRARKETVDTDIPEISRNGNRKIMQSIRITSRPPSRKRKKIIFQSNTNRKDLTWPHFDDEQRVQEKQQVKDQQSCIFVFVACLTIPSSNQGHQPRCDNSIPYMGVYGRFIGIQSNLRREKLHRTN